MEQAQISAIKKLNSNSGQAVVEYTLLMVIIVALCIGIGKGFGTLNNYLQRYIGDYTACLMEYGELPSLGTKVNELNRHAGGTGKKCDQEYKPFSFVDGRPSSGGSGSAGSSSGQNGKNSNSAGGGNGNNGSNSNKNASNASKNGNSDDSKGSNGSGGSDELGNGGSSKSPYKNGQIARAGTPFGTIEGNDDSKRVKIIEGDEEGDSSRKRKSNKNLSAIRPDYDRSGYHAVNGKMQEEYEKSIKNKVLRTPTSTVTVMNLGGSGILPIKSKLMPRESEKPKTSEDDNSKMSFGGFLRFLIIAGMVVSIIVFFGGQIMNYSNSQD